MNKQFFKMFNNTITLDKTNITELKTKLNHINDVLDDLVKINDQYRNFFDQIKILFFKILNLEEPVEVVINRIIQELYLNLEVTQVWFSLAHYKDGKLFGSFELTIGENSGNLPKGHIFDIENNLPNYKTLLKTGTVVVSKMNKIDNRDKEFLSMWPIKTVVLIPLKNDEKLWGCIGLVNHDKYRNWSPLEVTYFRLLAVIFSGFITDYIKLQNLKEKTYILNTLDNDIPRYSWKKDKLGRYLYVDDDWVRLFYPGFSSYLSLIGETDIGAIEYFRKLEGNSHTFGELCKGSDDICVEERKETHFIEIGSINGNILLLYVIKKPNYSNDIYDNIIGIGYDISFLGIDQLTIDIQKLIDQDALNIIQESYDPLIMVFQFKDKVLGKKYLHSLLI